ncbi:MAG: hypothetical protein GXY01_09980 [Clostridiales bacterium]|nr:hypothetical protein [Clostridiales bacterium]
MEFRIRHNYNKNLFKNLHKEENKAFNLAFKILLIIAIILNVCVIVLFGDMRTNGLIRLILLLFLSVIWFNMPALTANILMAIIKKRKLDGERILTFNDQTFSSKNLKYDTETSYPISKIKKIKRLGNYYKIWVDRKWVYIDTREFEVGDAEEFYDWIANLINN